MNNLHPLQTKEWGEFREAWGNKIVWHEDFLIIFSLIPHTPWKIGTIIRSRMPSENDLVEIKKIGINENAIFIKFEPFDFAQGEHTLKKYCIQGKTLFTPTSFWIDLTKSEDELLKSFSSKTRYNIKLALKHSVVIKEDNSDKAFEKYLNLTFETANRQNFFVHTKKYHQLMWKHMKKYVHLFTATYNKEIITTWIIFKLGEFIYYPYGASTDKHKEVMANNLMMWEVIKWGKKNGAKTFDLWGREIGKGFTKFKEGYNPQVVEFVGSWDLVINRPLYYIYRIAEKLRWFVLKNVKAISKLR